jgi:hypothetical protein
VFQEGYSFVLESVTQQTLSRRDLKGLLLISGFACAVFVDAAVALGFVGAGWFTDRLGTRKDFALAITICSTAAKLPGAALITRLRKRR